MEENANIENHIEKYLIATLRKNFHMGSIYLPNDSLINIATNFFLPMSKNLSYLDVMPEVLIFWRDCNKLKHLLGSVCTCHITIARLLILQQLLLRYTLEEKNVSSVLGEHGHVVFMQIR